jgi:hypothetical protein
MIETIIGLATATYLFARAFRVAASGLATLDRLLLGRQAIKKAPPEKVGTVTAELAKWESGPRPKRS